MENEEMKITPQDIIDREFKVKFRGFDMAEVDAFLEEVAESFFKLTEENTLLNEKVLALQQELEVGGSMAPRGLAEIPAELENMLEDLKQDTTRIGAELISLKQDRQIFDSIKEKLGKAVASLGESSAAMASQPQVEFPADLANTLQEFKQSSEAIAAELAALKEDRLALDSLKKDLEKIISSAKEAVTSASPQQTQGEIPGDLGKTLEGFQKGTETMGAELATLTKQVGTIAGLRAEIKGELQELLASRFAELEAKLSAAGDVAVPKAPEPKAAPSAPGKKEKLVVAEIIEEPEAQEEDTRLPDYEEQDDDYGESALEFLSEDDILDVDKLRGIFQSVLDEGISDGHESREGEEASADLLFLEEDFIDDEHEPEVTFSLDEKETGTKTKSKRT